MRVVVLAAARRDLDKLSLKNFERIAEAIDLLAVNPRPQNCKLLRDRKSRTWRIRVGDWRVLYDIDDAKGVVTILRVRHRSRVY